MSDKSNVTDEIFVQPEDAFAFVSLASSIHIQSLDDSEATIMDEFVREVVDSFIKKLNGHSIGDVAFAVLSTLTVLAANMMKSDPEPTKRMIKRGRSLLLARVLKIISEDLDNKAAE